VPAKPKKNVDVPEYARKIRELRESRGENQTAFAAVLGVKPSSVSKWEAGKSTPTPRNCADMAVRATGEIRRFFQKIAGLDFLDGGILLPLPSADQSPAAVRPSEPPPEPSLDTELLAAVIAMIDRELKRRGKHINSTKYAEIIAMTYADCHRLGRLESGTMERLLKIAS
jgi:transcriptional regulator with XRE-family HTH domain